MLTTIATAIAQNVILGWIWRRLQELVSWAMVLVPFYLAMPPEMQAVVIAIVTGKGGGLTVSAVIGFAYYLFTQWQSWRATVKPQVVTTDARKIALPKTGEGSGTTRKVEHMAESVPNRRTLWELLTGN